VWTRAWENQTYVAYVNRCGTERATHYVGLSSIYGPSGDLLARADVGPALLSADIDPHARPAAQRALGNNYLAERRPDLYSGFTRLTNDAATPIRKHP
jgi:predicted amidohydrolase